MEQYYKKPGNLNTNSQQDRNPASSLFRRLTRLFSGPLADHDREQQKRFKRRDLDKFKFKSASGSEFKKSAYSPLEQLQIEAINNQHRLERYIDFDQMEFEPILHSAIDIYAEEMTTSSHLEPLLNIQCKNEEIKSILAHLFDKILDIKFNLFGWCRAMCKHGDYFLYLDIDEKMGVQRVIGLPPHEIERLEGEDKTNPDYIQFQWNSGGMTFENWQMAHFRIMGNDKFAPYGTSVLDGARRIWRQLVLLEDAMMAYRIVRAPERRVFYMDVGNLPPTEVEQYMQKAITQMKRNKLTDPSTGRVDLRYNPLSVEEDYYIPVRGDVHSRIESLPGGTYTGDIDDVKYLKDKLLAAIKIPHSYLTRAEGSEEDKTTLAQKDIRFARTIQRLQRSVVSELEKIAIIHLYTLGYRGDDLINFELFLNNPSRIAELQQLEHWRTKFDIAAAATDGFFSNAWVNKNIFGMTKEQLEQNQREMYADRKFEAALEAAAAGMDGMMGMEGGMGGGLGGEPMGGEGPLGPLGPPMEDVEGFDAEGPAEEDGTLLASPGKREDDLQTIMRDKYRSGMAKRGRGKRKTNNDPKSKNYGWPLKGHELSAAKHNRRRRKQTKAIGARETGTGSTMRGRMPGSEIFITRDIGARMFESFERDEEQIEEIEKFLNENKKYEA